MLITHISLLDKLEKPDLILVDSRSYKEYSEGHIPGAVHLDLMHYHWADTSKGGLTSFEKQMRMILSFLGVTKDKTVIFYDEVSGMIAARGVWLLTYFSHTHAFMLDGGFKKWKAIGLPTETYANEFKPARFTGKVNRKVIAGFEYIKKEKNKIKLIDARTKEEYDGTVVRAARKGHIPTAVNIDWSQNLKDDGTLKTYEDLLKLYNFSKNDNIVTYCQGGYRAANTFLILKLLGFKNIKVYLGSWGEWGNRLDLPVDLHETK